MPVQKESFIVRSRKNAKRSAKPDPDCLPAVETIEQKVERAKKLITEIAHCDVSKHQQVLSLRDVQEHAVGYIISINEDIGEEED